MVRYEFGPSSCGRLAHGLGGAFCRDHHAMACGLREQAGAGCRPAGWLATFNAPASIRAERLQAEGGTPSALRGRRRSDRNRDISAKRRCLKGGVLRHACFRLMMSRWQIHHSPAATRAARVFCRHPVTSEQLSDPAPAAPFLYFPISSIDAPRGAVGWPRWPSQRIFVRGERVYHGQQNDHRRLTPGRDQGGGPPRQSRRGI